MQGVSVKLPMLGKGIRAAVGTKFYIDGKELKDVLKFQINPTGADDILTITLTLPLAEILN